MQVPSETARNWYIKEASEQMWSYATLNRNISTQYYERLLMSQQKEPVEAEMKALTKDFDTDKLEFIKNPVVAEFLGMSPTKAFVESELETAILNNLQKFLLELGKGFSFVERQKLVRTENDKYFIDLVFYNFRLKCFVLVDLKVGKITHQDVGQMKMYVNMYDKMMRDDDDNPTLGIVLCSETDEDIAEFWLNDEKNVLSEYNTAEAKGLARPMTHLITLNQSANERREHTMRINVAKSRFFERGEVFKIATDYENEVFYDRTRTMNINKVN